MSERGQIMQGVDASLSREARDPDLTPRQRLALACRILADEGHARTLAGQVTLRDGESFWTTGFSRGLAETAVGNLVRIDGQMTVLEGRFAPNPAVRFHMWIYRARPDFNCIVHTHPPHAAALSVTGHRLASAHMDAAMFHEDCAYLAEWPGVPVADEEGRLISEALGDKRAILLAHHGLLTGGRTLEEAVYLAVTFEHAARLTLLARAIGDIREIDAGLAAEAHDFVLKPRFVEATFDYWARQALRRHADAV